MQGRQAVARQTGRRVQAMQYGHFGREISDRNKVDWAIGRSTTMPSTSVRSSWGRRIFRPAKAVADTMRFIDVMR
jgi:hypothetical protein